MAGALKVGIIGTGKHGSRYARHILHDVDGLELAAISRRSAEGEKQARAWGARYHRDWQQLVDDPEVEAVIAVTTPNLNLDIAGACALAGKALLMEKPLAPDAAAAGKIVDIFSQNNLPLTVAQTLRYNTTILALKEYLPKAGRLFSFYANQRLEPSDHPWLEDPELAGAGVILHTAVHLFDALRFITGKEVVRVRATMFQRHNPKLEDLFTALIELNHDLVGTVDASKVGPARSGRFEFVGSKGQLQGDQVHGFVDFLHHNGIEPLDRKEPISTIVPLLDDWREYILGTGPNPIPGEEGLAAVRICEACRKSALEDRWISL